MGGLHFLDLVIGLAFIYFLLSIICLSLQELKANLLDERSKNLEKWIKDTFNDRGRKKENSGLLGKIRQINHFLKRIIPFLEKLINNILNGKGREKENLGLGDRIWKNIMVDGLTRSKRTVSYIPKEVFVSALLDEIYYGSDDSNQGRNSESELENEQELINGLKPTYDFHSLKAAIENPSVCLPKPFQRVIRQVYSESHENLETFRMRLERWFEMAMVRNSGTYKKKAQWWTFGFAVLVTLGINVDTIKLSSHFYDNPNEAKRIADQAEVYLKNNPEQKIIGDKKFKETVETIRADINKINELKLPLGWEDYEWVGCTEEGWMKIFKFLPGWIITIFAVSLGSPFWFDTLNKLVNLRAAGKAPNGGNNSTSGDEKKAQHTDTAVG